MTSTYVPEDIEMRRKAFDLLTAALAAEKALEDNDPAQSGIDDADLGAKASSAWAAYEEAEGPALLGKDDYDDTPVLCAVSGVPIWATDETLVDEVTGEFVLRAAIGLPPRPESDEDEDDDVEEAA